MNHTGLRKGQWLLAGSGCQHWLLFLWCCFPAVGGGPLRRHLLSGGPTGPDADLEARMMLLQIIEAAAFCRQVNVDYLVFAWTKMICNQVQAAASSLLGLAALN